ncbi:LCP family protein [Corynebacterium sp. TAE3-ERU16]|uniref:LCP family protein n=1 Tax=Corynebacterium sp. TAE3-ERU16 TaxID=2849493 RepID=UPI001C493D59|nr:LCP family protein [Corynebacterium sp. TAE3-ERU16]MBV7294244.1 LCP family protein [Corynebacterium sp. TAE3-ERU16]
MDSRGPSQHGDLPDDIARDSRGRPILDRFGRPVRRRGPGGSSRPRPEAGRHAHGERSPRERLQDRPVRSPRGDTGVTRYTPRPQERPPYSRSTPPPERPIQYRPEARPVPAYRRESPVPPPKQPPVHPERRGGGRRDYSPEPRSRRPRRRRGRGCGMGCMTPFLLAIGIVLTLTVVIGLWADAKLNRVEATPTQQVANTAGTNWLLVGSDSRQGLTQEEIDTLGTGGDIGVGRTDTIMLLHYGRGSKPTLVSIPRDSYVNVPGYGMNKINSAFTFGGPQLLTETVEQATGLRIDHYAEIGFGGFAGLVDAVGGVEMCVTEAINDPLANIDLPAGCQKLNGPDALGYVRSRAFEMGDLDRVSHQREFLSALMEKATDPTTLLNPFRLGPLIGRASGTFTVGTGDHIWNLARLALAMRSGVVTETVPVGGFQDTAVGNVVLWDDAAARSLFDSLR